jgi:hypothetical protein
MLRARPHFLLAHATREHDISLSLSTDHPQTHLISVFCPWCKWLNEEPVHATLSPSLFLSPWCPHHLHRPERERKRKRDGQREREREREKEVGRERKREREREKEGERIVIFKGGCLGTF